MKTYIKFTTILLLVVFLCTPVIGLDDTHKWSMNSHQWDGKKLPTLGLQKDPGALPVMAPYHLASDVGLPSKVDWRTTPYGTRVSPVNDQGNCGACVAYAITGQVESAFMIKANSTKYTDLAELEFFSHGGNCATGWIFEKAYPYTVNPGEMSQSCYDSGQCSNRYPILSWTTTKDPKLALQNGPIVTGVNWDYNWFYYDSGIINDYTGDVAGGHAIEIVGYDDSQNCWIVKNSWGTGWGESGFFRIDYNTAAEAGFGSYAPWFTVSVNGGPGPTPPTPTYQDFKITIPGTYYVSFVSKTPIADASKDLKENGVSLGPIKGLPTYKTGVTGKLLGKFAKGDIIQFDVNSDKHTTKPVYINGYDKGWRYTLSTGGFTFYIEQRGI